MIDSQTEMTAYKARSQSLIELAELTLFRSCMTYPIPTLPTFFHALQFHINPLKHTFL